MAGSGAKHKNNDLRVGLPSRGEKLPQKVRQLFCCNSSSHVVVFWGGKQMGSFSLPSGCKCDEFLAQGFVVFGATRNGAPIFGAKKWRSFWLTVWRSFWHTFWRSFWFPKLAQFVCSLLGAVALVAEHDYSNIKNASGEHSCAFRLRIS